MNLFLKASLVPLLLCCGSFLLQAQDSESSTTVQYVIDHRSNTTAPSKRKQYNYNYNYDNNHNYNKTSHAKLGVSLEKDETGVRIKKVYKNSAAAAAGLEVGDRLIAFDGVKIWGHRQLVAMIKHNKGGENVRVDYQRNGQILWTSTRLDKKTNSNNYRAFESPCEQIEKIYGRPFLGVYLDRSHQDETAGARITSIIKNTGAAASSLQAEDRIISLDGTTIRNSSDVHYHIQNEKKPTEPIQIEVLRGGERVALTAVVGSWGDRQDMRERLIKYEAACKAFNDPATACATLQEMENQPFLGVYMSNVEAKDGGGALINSVIEGTQAAQTTLRGGDKIVQFNGVAINSHPDATKMILSTQPGQAVTLQVLRGDQRVTVTGKMGSMTEHQSNREKAAALSEVCEQQQPDDTPATTNLEDYTTLTLFPNPANDYVNVVYEGQTGNLVVSITTLDGKSLYDKRVPEFEGTYNDQIDLSNFPAGIYVLYITQGEKRTSKQLVVE